MDPRERLISTLLGTAGLWFYIFIAFTMPTWNAWVPAWIADSRACPEVCMFCHHWLAPTNWGVFFQPTGWNWQKSQGSTLFEHYWNPLFIDDFWELYQQSNREIPIDHQVLMPNLVVYLCRLSRQGWIQDGHDPVGNLMLLQPLVKHLMFFSRNRETPWSLGTAF